MTTTENIHGCEEAPKRFEHIVKMALSITGMHCDACVEAVRAALTRVPGILESDIRLGDVVVTFDEAKAGRADILAAIRNAGAFDVSGFSTSP
ncbi:MAG: heavy-metal-associated domain-containing protein [Planctomycetota bacterium]|jgi:copper chaperone CopZ